MKPKKLPSFVTHPLLVRFFQSKAGRIVSNWVLQGMLYMNPVETAYKLGLDALATWALWALWFHRAGPVGLLAAWFTAHTLNWILNGQPIAMMRHLDWGTNDPRRFVDYVERLHRRLQGRRFLRASASFGSLSRGGYKAASDIDIRVVMGSGPVDKFRTAQFCFLERLRAAMAGFPLDLYAFEMAEMQRKMRADEVPVAFYDPEGLVVRHYAETVRFETFIGDLRAQLLGGSKA